MLPGSASPADFNVLELFQDSVRGPGQVRNTLQTGHLRQHMLEGLDAEELLVVDRVPDVDVPVELPCGRRTCTSRMRTATSAPAACVCRTAQAADVAFWGAKLARLPFT